MAGVPVIEPVGAAALAKDVAKLVEHGEGVIVLQDARARLAESGGCLDPELGFAFAGLDRRYGHDAAPVPTSLSRGPGSPGGDYSSAAWGDAQKHPRAARNLRVPSPNAPPASAPFSRM